MINRMSLGAAAVFGAVMTAMMPTTASACGPYGCGYGYGYAGVGVGVGVNVGYGYGAGYGYGGYGYGGGYYGAVGYGSVNYYGYGNNGYAQSYYAPSSYGYGYGYGAPAYTAYTTYYAQPASYYPQPSYPSYRPCCRANFWDGLFGSSNCCVQAQPYVGAQYYGEPAPYAGWGAQYAAITPYGGYGYRPAYVAPPRPYIRPWVRRQVVYRPGYRPYVGYRSRVVYRTHVVRPHYRPRHRHIYYR